ncbi:nitrate reductase [Bordetella genomosp. 4]|uniref:nitrate reductase n=1 Tax=Bordetella genomosp. 4 TaxID=463044 RepID=UPI000B9E03A2|nr:nitrate reductase [Bordetella genomosp. 4]OZI43116.1 nitrate reductase [Bordetella genomosp. 4]
MTTTIKIAPVDSPVRTTCPYCGVGCGVLATPQPDGEVHIEGDIQHPANGGRLCVKGSALGETVGLEGRLLHPAVRQAVSYKTAPLQRVSWDQALDAVAQGFRRIIESHGPDAVAFYVSGQLLTEDYYVANKLMKGFIGSANIDTNSRLCMSSAVAGHKRAFGEDLVPVCYDDLELADLVVLVGSNAAWCHPILFQRIARAKEARPDMKLVVVDPRHTATCELADLHLPIKPGTDVWLFNGLLAHLVRQGLADERFVAEHTAGLEEALLAADADSDIASVARDCRLDEESVRTFFQWFIERPRTITAFSQGVNQSSAGTDKVNSIINCHLLTGRIGQPGMGPFSITGQPNAMGGREVGGLANMLAAHLELHEPAHRELVQAFWDAPRMADRVGLKAVDLFRAIEAGRVKAVWIMGTNPVVSLPDADQVRRALDACELVVVSDIVAHTDTMAHADIVLPALGWGEKDGTVTNSERRISRQRAFLPAPGEARADWDIIADVARRMGYEGFSYRHQREVFDEHARLSAQSNEASLIPRAFHIGGLARLSPAAYEALTPVQWPLPSPGDSGAARLFSDGGFSHADGRARFVPTPVRTPEHAVDDEYPLILNTGRVRDQWHTMTRTGRAPKLAEHVPEPFIDLHPHDALLAGVREGALARVRSRWGSMVARVRQGGGIARGSVFVPIHWNGQFASDARVGAVVNPVVDPVSGEPEFKHTPVMVEPFDVAWHGFVLTRRELNTHDVAWWTRIQGRQFLRYELAGRQLVDTPHDWTRALLGVSDAQADWLEYEDRTARIYRAVYLIDDRIEACVYLSPRPDLPSRQWLASLFAQARLEDIDRAGVLLGQPIVAGADTGPVICSCFGVGRNTICDAIRDKRLQTTGDITACVKAGGNCGSCVPELKRLLTETQVLMRAAA